jgi:type III restriction enzyme
VTPETARLLQHWRHHQFDNLKPFFCQIEAIETAIWLAEVASDRAAAGAKLWTHIRGANKEANPELLRIALKLATGAGKTTVMAMLIAWQTVNAVRHPGSNRFSRAFLVVTPGITIKDRLRVLLPNDPNSYYRERELVPTDMLGDIERRQDRHHKLPRLPPARALGGVEDRPSIAAGARAGAEHARNRGADAAARLRRFDGAEEHRRAQ